MAGDFGGEVASFSARYRRGYPPAFIEALAQALRLDTSDVVADVGCGTGQLTIPLAAASVPSRGWIPNLRCSPWQNRPRRDRAWST
jgi:hypothetical protein